MFTLETAKQAKDNNSLMQWAIDFVNNDGNNKNLAKELQKNNDWIWADLVKFPLNKLESIMGKRGDGFLYEESEEHWNGRIDSLYNDINYNNHVPCPLIVTDFWGKINISDGNHRKEAFLKNGINEYWVIFIIKNKENIDWILKNSI